MKQDNYFSSDMLDLNAPEAQGDVFYLGGKISGVEAAGDTAVCTLPMQVQEQMPNNTEYNPNLDGPKELQQKLEVKAYGESIIRIRIAFDGSPMSDTGPILSLDPELENPALSVEEVSSVWKINDSKGRTIAEVDNTPFAHDTWTDALDAQIPEQVKLAVYPNANTKVEFVYMDSFISRIFESAGLGCVMRDGQPDRSTFAVYCDQNEKFAGTGERFCNTDLRGQLLQLQNTDGIGTNSRRTYKNVPLYLSSHGYAIFMHTSAHVRLSLAAVSGNAVSAMIEEPVIDLFVIGGGSVPKILENYCRLTGFVPELPLWSYGTWMSRITYVSDDEISTIAAKMRERKHPCDVLHIDTGWFENDWVCDWRFSPTRFPDPAGFMKRMDDLNFKVSLWQTPYIRNASPVAGDALEKGYLGQKDDGDEVTGSDFGNGENAGHIDFSNPDAVKWYQDMLAGLFDVGAAAIKTDFGEDVMRANYHMPYRQFQNLYCLLYQKAAFETTQEKTGSGVIWARAGWAGAHRYPVHWGGDSQCSWNGLLSTLKGALHIGLSGFAYWSSDIPGFYGYPVAFHSKPSDELYVRWTQFGVFGSHMRYHGDWPREPWEYPAVEGITRSWLNLRYMLIPYILQQSKVAATTGLPLMRSLIVHHMDDPICWQTTDQYYFGDSLLIAPVANDDGVRDVYLPEGMWVDLWTGETLEGATMLKQVKMPLSRIPVYVKKGAEIPVYPDVVQSTAEMELEKVVCLVFDGTYDGFENSVLNKSGVEASVCYA